MKKMSFFLLVFLISGCTHKVYLSLTPDYGTQLAASSALSEITPGLTFVKGDFEDKRYDVSLYAVFSEGIHIFNLYAQRPVNEAIFDGLAAMLDKSGQKWSEEGDGQVKVNLQLLSSNASRVAGFVDVSAASSIQIKLDFLDAGSGDLIYSREYQGKDERSKAMIGPMDMVKESIDASIVNCIKDVASDKALAQALNK